MQSIKYVRYHWIPAGLKSQATAVEILDGILADALRVGTITWRRGILLLLVIRVHRTRGAIPRVSRHRDWEFAKQSFWREYYSFTSIFASEIRRLSTTIDNECRHKQTCTTEISSRHAVGHLGALWVGARGGQSRSRSRCFGASWVDARGGQSRRGIVASAYWIGRRDDCSTHFSRFVTVIFK